MASEMIQALEDLEKEKGIRKDYMLDRISQALVAADLLGLTTDTDWVLGYEDADTIAKLTSAIAEVFGPRPDGAR